MLIRPCRKVIKAVNYLCSANPEHSTSSIDLIVYFRHKIKDLDLHDTIQVLIDDGYLAAKIENGAYSDIKPTYRGRHYSEYRWLNIKEVLLKSLLLPILVSFITTLLTLALNGIFTVKI